jgi:hypothetical protein
MNVVTELGLLREVEVYALGGILVTVKHIALEVWQARYALQVRLAQPLAVGRIVQ